MCWAVLVAVAAQPSRSERRLSTPDERRIARPGRSRSQEYPLPVDARSRVGSVIKSQLADTTTSSGVWPAPVLQSYGGPFQPLGVNVSATGDDCAYLNHGPADNATVCEAACDSTAACNLVNFSPSIPDCVLRACVNPLAPELSPDPGYSVFATQKLVFALDSTTFSIVATGFSNDLLDAAILRYGGIVFPYGPSAASGDNTAGGTTAKGSRGAPATSPTVQGLCVNVLSADTALRLGVDESYNLTVAGDAVGHIRSAVGPRSLRRQQQRGDVDDSADVAATAACPFVSVLTAHTVFGAMRGLETFAQLVQWNWTSNAYSVPQTRITDAPRFPFRGVLLDPARHFLPVGTIKLVLDAMAAVKLNALHLHLTGGLCGLPCLVVTRS